MRPPILVFAINRGLQLKPQFLPTASEGVAYSQDLGAVLGQPPYRFEISPPDALDDLGLTFTDNGDDTATIAGATPVEGSASFGVTVYDADERQVHRSYTMRVADIPQPPEPVEVSGDAPDGEVGEAYSYTFSATGGDGGPYTWTVQSGALPDGVTLNSGTGEISGTLTDDGTFSFTIRATDGAGSYGDHPDSVDVTSVPVVGDVFVAHYYTGDGTSGRKLLGPDMAASGGLLWIKANTAVDHAWIYSTNGSTLRRIAPNSTAVATTSPPATFDVDGVTLTDASLNATSVEYVAYLFKRDPGFFDVVRYTGTGAAQNVAHSLASAVGLAWFKNEAATTNWRAFHRALGGTAAIPGNANSLPTTASTYFNNTAPTSSVFTVGTSSDTNVNAGAQVAFLWAHNPSGFIAADEYTGTGVTAGPDIVVGWQPQYILTRRITGGSGDWPYLDQARSPGFTGSEEGGVINNAGNWGTPVNFVSLIVDGYRIEANNSSNYDVNGSRYSYLAVRAP